MSSPQTSQPGILEANPSNLRLFLGIFPATWATFMLYVGSNLINAFMASRISLEAMAAVALAGSFIWPLNSLGYGALSVLLSKISYAIGTNQPEQAGRLYKQGYYLCWLVTAIIWLILLLISFNLDFIGIEPDVEAIAQHYIWISMLIVPLNQLMVLARNLNSAIGQTTPTLYANILGIVLLIPLNWLFMYGNFPGLGGVDHPEFSALSQLIIALVTLSGYNLQFAFRTKIYQGLKLFTPVFVKPDGKVLWDTIKLGLPVSVQAYVENSFYALVIVFLAHLGTTTVAAHESGMVLYGITYQVGGTCSVAMTSIVARRLGQNRLDLEKSAFAGILATCAVLNLIQGILVVIFRDDLAGILTRSNPTAHAMAAKILLFLAVANFFDGLYTTLIGYLVAYRDSKFSMYVSLGLTWVVFFPIFTALAFWEIPTHGAWWAFGVQSIGGYGVWAYWASFVTIGAACMFAFLARALYRWQRISPEELKEIMQKQAEEPQH